MASDRRRLTILFKKKNRRTDNCCLYGGSLLQNDSWRIRFLWTSGILILPSAIRPVPNPVYADRNSARVIGPCLSDPAPCEQKAHRTCTRSARQYIYASKARRQTSIRIPVQKRSSSQGDASTGRLCRPGLVCGVTVISGYKCPVLCPPRDSVNSMTPFLMKAGTIPLLSRIRTR